MLRQLHHDKNHLILSFGSEFLGQTQYFFSKARTKHYQRVSTTYRFYVTFLMLSCVSEWTYGRLDHDNEPSYFFHLIHISWSNTAPLWHVESQLFWQCYLWFIAIFEAENAAEINSISQKMKIRLITRTLPHPRTDIFCDVEKNTRMRLKVLLISPPEVKYICFSGKSISQITFLPNLIFVKVKQYS